MMEDVLQLCICDRRLSSYTKDSVLLGYYPERLILNPNSTLIPAPRTPNPKSQAPSPKTTKQSS